MEELALFKRFYDPGQANELVEELKANGIDCQLVEDFFSVDITFTGGSGLDKEYQVMLKQSDFEKANKILTDKAFEQLTEVSKDYYLFEFSNDELFEILQKPDEWSALDYQLALKILKDRGQNITEDYLISAKQNRINNLSKPEKRQDIWVPIGYFCAILGGLLGIIIGWGLWKLKKTLPNGEKVYIYSDKDRVHGRRIFTIGAIVFPITFLQQILDKLKLLI